MKINNDRISAILSPSTSHQSNVLADEAMDLTAGRHGSGQCHPGIGRCDMFIAAHFTDNPIDGDETLIFKFLNDFLKKHPTIEPAMHKWALGMSPATHGIPYNSDPDEAKAKLILAHFLHDTGTDAVIRGGKPLVSQRDFYCYIPDPLGHELVRVCYAEFMINELIASKPVPVIKKLRTNQQFMLTFVLRFRVPVLKPEPNPTSDSMTESKVVNRTKAINSAGLL